MLDSVHHWWLQQQQLERHPPQQQWKQPSAKGMGNSGMGTTHACRTVCDLCTCSDCQQPFMSLDAQGRTKDDYIDGRRVPAKPQGRGGSRQAHLYTHTCYTRYRLDLELKCLMCKQR